MRILFSILLLLASYSLHSQFLTTNVVVEMDTMVYTDPGSFQSPWRYSRSDTLLYRWDYGNSAWTAFSGGGSSGSVFFDSNRPILRVPQVGDNIGGSTIQDFLNAFYTTPPELSSTIVGTSFFEIGTSNTVDFRTVLNNPAGIAFTDYEASEQGKGVVATFPDGSQATRTNVFQFTYAPVQSPVGGVGVYDDDEYRFSSELTYNGTETATSNTATVRAGYPVLYGMVAEVDTATAFADPYGELSGKLVEAEGDKQVDFTGTGLIVYGFPQTWSDTNLSNIEDPNGFPAIASFDRRTDLVVTSTGLTNNYTNVPYVFYILNTGATTTANSTYTFER